jgi:two-component system, NtrC family, sensor kinase
MRGKGRPMHRGPKPAKDKVKAKLPGASKSRQHDGAKVRDLEKRLAEALGQLQARDRELAEAQDQRTATSEILEVISHSPSEVQTVSDMIAENAARLCDAIDVTMFQIDSDVLRVVVHRGPIPSASVGQARPLVRETPTGRAVLDRRTIHVADVQAEIDEYPEGSARARRLGYRTILAAPLLHVGEAIGAIVIRRTDARPFTDRQVDLLHTFANQAVIAIENVRLFTELQASNLQLTTALEQQTATGEILRVISSSPTDEKPVFDAIARSSIRLCGAAFSVVAILDADEMLHLVASGHVGTEGRHSLAAAYPMRPNRGQLAGRAILDRVVVHVPDVVLDPEYVGAALGNRATLSVPMLRQGIPIGTITIARFEPLPFGDQQIELLQTFADQAVIAIENVRLFRELQTRNTDLTDALSRQTATSEILRVISGSPTDIQPVFDTIVRSAVTLCNGVFGSLDRFDGDLIYPVATHNYTPQALDAVHCIFPARPRRSLGVGRAILDRDVVHIPDVELDPEYKVQNLAGTIGFRSGLFVPMLRDGVPIGVILVGRAEPGPFSENQIELLKTFADQAVIAIENVRLFKELEAANRELAAASQHKSEFLANMSHELRTPLNAIIGFSEMLSEKMFGELNEKQEEYSKDIHASGQHLLSLINDILDLSKVEAGRMELELTEFHLPTALDSALTLVRERAGRRSITLHMSVDERLGEVRGDERKIRQVVLNLLSNAIKFTPEGGRIEVRALPVDVSVEVSVTDTGVGIAAADQEAVFEEFRQVGTADKKAEGTGLGLTLCRKFIELHGGRIWVTSQAGAGSTFTFTIPVRRGE